MKHFIAIGSWLSELSINIESKAYYKTAEILNQQGDVDGAINSYNLAIKLKPDFPAAYHNLGIALMKRGEINSAISSFNTALQLKPSFPEAHVNLGLAFERAGDLSSAISSYKKAINIYPNLQDIQHRDLSNIQCKNREKNTTIFVTFDASKEQPLENIIMDESPLFYFALFDYSGSFERHQQSRIATIRSGDWEQQCKLLSAATSGKGEIIKHIANDTDITQNKYIGIFDDDIIIKVSDINRAVLIGETSGFASFQPSLARCSFYTHNFTVNQPTSTVRRVAWTEIMMPIIKKDLLLAAKPFLDKNLSSYGIDCFVFPMLALTENISGCHAVIDASIATHIRKTRSHDKIYRNGFTAREELILTKNSCKQYLADKGIDPNESDALRELFAYGPQ